VNRDRLRELLVAHALAEGGDASVALQTAGGVESFAASAEVKAGRLASGLRKAGMADDLVRLAEAWPAALRPALRRLARIPSRVVHQIQLVEVATLLALVAYIQVAALGALQEKVLPAMAAMVAEGIGPDRLLDGWVTPVSLVLILAPPVGLALAVLGFLFPRFSPGWRRHMGLAREAALAAALDESDAPPEARRTFGTGFRRLDFEHSGQEELDLVLGRSIAQATATRRRVVAAVRFWGFAFLATVGGGMSLLVFHFISKLALL
jgi:hypothetical protein